MSKTALTALKMVVNCRPEYVDYALIERVLERAERLEKFAGVIEKLVNAETNRRLCSSDECPFCRGELLSLEDWDAMAEVL